VPESDPGSSIIMNPDNKSIRIASYYTTLVDGIQEWGKEIGFEVIQVNRGSVDSVNFKCIFQEKIVFFIWAYPYPGVYELKAVSEDNHFNKRYIIGSVKATYSLSEMIHNLKKVKFDILKIMMS
jgi:hypothetical protein